MITRRDTVVLADVPRPPSLLLLFSVEADAAGGGGGGGAPGCGTAPGTPDLSTVTVFLSFVPVAIEDKRSSRPPVDLDPVGAGPGGAAGGAGGAAGAVGAAGGRGGASGGVSDADLGSGSGSGSRSGDN